MTWEGKLANTGIYAIPGLSVEPGNRPRDGIVAQM